jgi:DNA-binding transcriptional regulator YdaS (Cro superfamily)
MRELSKAISILGSQGALGAAVGVGQSAVANWLKRGTVPAEYCPRIESATGGQVTCEGLCPDVAWSVLRNSAEAAPTEPTTEPTANA